LTEANFDIVRKREEVTEFLPQLLPEKQVAEVSQLLGNYFLNRAEDAFESIAAEKAWMASEYESRTNEQWRKSIYSSTQLNS
jgi:hypothetical protein